MKILQFPNYITIDGIKGFSRNRTGYGYMAIDIALSTAAQGVEVDLLTQSYITKGLKYKNVNILRRTWNDIITNLKIRCFYSVIKAILLYRIPVIKIPNILLYYISMGYFEKLLKANNYDLIHIHGIGLYNLPIIETCRKNNIKYIVTLHGLYAFNDGISITDRVKKIEKDFLKYAKANNIPITVISTGVRLTILNFLGLKDSKNFSVITNSFNLIIDNKKEEINLRKKYKIKSNSKIMISVGNIGRRKNQEQIIRAYSMLPISVKENLVILFFGYDTTDSKFKSKLLSSVSVSNLKYCGDIPKNDLSGVYSQADYVILASISEGFGLSIIEGFSFGVPCITFSDLDAVLDLFDEKSMYLVENRSDEALAKGIEAFVNIEWDKNEIIKHSQKFTIEKMALNYIDVFVQVIEKS